jgi:hypothetical protein
MYGLAPDLLERQLHGLVSVCLQYGMHAHTYIYHCNIRHLCAYVCVRLSVCLYVYVCVYVYVYVYYVYVYVYYVHVHVHVHLHAHVYVYAYAYAYVYGLTIVCAHVRIKWMCVSIRMYHKWKRAHAYIELLHTHT